MKLSPAQQQVVDHRGGDLQVIACAGSGKTESISRRVAALINEGAEPASIVAFTFTERAATELKERIVRRVAEVKGAAFRDRLGPMFVGTIHAYCFRLLQDHVPEYGNYDILDEHRHAGFLSREYRALGLSKIGTKHWQPIRDFAKTVDVLGNELIDPSKLDGTPLGECVAAYGEALDRFHLLTFSSIISTAVEALEDPAIFQRVHAPLRHLLVDEYQDINPAQERLIELLATDPVQLCVVGDDDQSIYQWRGSEIRNILDFANRRVNVKSVVLDENRRSRPEIVRTANEFADTIPQRLPKKMSPTRTSGERELVPWSADNDEAEAEQIAETILRLHEKGYRYRDIAVLFRSVRTAAPPLLAAFEAHDIPFTCGGRTGLFLQPEISLFGEVFAWFVDGEWKDERYGQQRAADIDSVVAGLCGHFEEAPSAKDLRDYLEDWKKYQLRGTRTVDLIDDFYRLLAQLGAQRLDVDDPVDAARLGAFARFSVILADFEGVHRRGRKTIEDGKVVFHGGRDRGKPYFQALHNYLLHYARDAYEDFAGEPDVELDAVDVLTVHQAKGLEWPVVFVPSLVKGRFPSQRAGQAQTWLLPEAVFPAATRGRYEGGDPEERRLFYVAITRARDALYLSHFDRKARNFKRSPYVDELLDGPSPKHLELPLPGPPEATAQKEPPTLEISFSDLARVEECGHAYRLGTGFAFEQSLAPELGYGRAVHHVLRHVAERVQSSGKLPSMKDLETLVDEEMYVPFATGPAYDQMRTSALRLVKRYVAEHSEDLHRIWAVERPFALHSDDGVITGRADVILDREGDRDGSLAIVDYKVAHDAARDERYRLQLAVYAAAGRGEGLTVDAAYLHELRDGSRVPVDVGASASSIAATRVEALLHRTRVGDLPPRPEATRCSSCGFRRVCKHAATKG